MIFLLQKDLKVSGKIYLCCLLDDFYLCDSYSLVACLNFLKLCKLKSYNFNLFHHVERNFLCQTGDPTGTGRGGESIFGYDQLLDSVANV